MTAPLDHASKNSQRGFTLIEVLIAALVLSVGLIGLAGLSAVSLKMNYSSSVRAQATSLAYEIADAMRANRTNAGSYEEDVDATCVKDFTRPTVGTVAAADLAEWANRLACSLPEGTGTIARNFPTRVNIFTITVNWNESRMDRMNEDEDEDEFIQSFSFSAEL